MRPFEEWFEHRQRRAKYLTRHTCNAGSFAGEIYFIGDYVEPKARGLGTSLTRTSTLITYRKDHVRIEVLVAVQAYEVSTAVKVRSFPNTDFTIKIPLRYLTMSLKCFQKVDVCSVRGKYNCQFCQKCSVNCQRLSRSKSHCLWPSQHSHMSSLAKQVRNANFFLFILKAESNFVSKMIRIMAINLFHIVKYLI